MIIKNYESIDDWKNDRLGKITGSKLKDIIVKRGTGHKIGFYELIAEKISLPADEEDRMERGNRLEKEAIECFMKDTEKKVNTDLVMWIDEKNEGIAISPDGFIEDEKGIITQGIEVKCLSSARHLQAFLEDQVPDEYYLQGIQYFIVNEELEQLYFVFYDPRIACKPFFYLLITRGEVAADVERFKQYQIDTMKEVNEIIEQLAF